MGKEIISLVIPVITGMILGGLLGKLGYSIMKQKLYILYVCSGGLLIGLLCFEIIPETIKEYNLIGTLLGFSLGILGMLIFDRALHHIEIRQFHKGTKHSVVFLLIAISLHNIPTGIALGSNISNDTTLSSSLLLILVLHHIPEGIALFISVAMANNNFLSFTLFTFLLTIILGLSIIFGHEFQFNSSKTNSLLMGAAIGTFSFVIIFEFLIKAFRKVSILEFSVFFIIGILAMKVYISILG